MKGEEFCNTFWKYYLMLERDFLDTERYVSFDSINSTDFKNGQTFSLEFAKEYQAICSEIEAILKFTCDEFFVNIRYTDKRGKPRTPNITEYFNGIQKKKLWSNISGQKVKMNDLELQPFNDWTIDKVSAWWTSHNDVKHNRFKELSKANLENVVNALAGLYILELYLIKAIGDRDDDIDAPKNDSNLFELVNFNTSFQCLGHNFYSSEICD